jgi:hypothetical protein
MTRREVPLDAARILQGLFAFEVAYTVIGGLAVQAHGHTRTTQDVDLVPRPDPRTSSGSLTHSTRLGRARRVKGLAWTRRPSRPGLPTRRLSRWTRRQAGILT